MPEKPTDYLTSAKSKEEELIFSLYWTKSVGKTHLFSQKAIAFLFFLNKLNSFKLSGFDFKFIFLTLSIVKADRSP